MEKDIKQLANELLSEDYVFHNYPEDILADATIIFFHVLIDATYAKHKKLPEENLVDFGADIGLRLHKLILDATGVDMHKAIVK